MATKIAIATQEDLEQLQYSLLTQMRKLLEENGLVKPEMMTTEQVQRMLNISFNTLSKLRKEYNIPCSRIGNRVYYRYADLLKLFDDCKS